MDFSQSKVFDELKQNQRTILAMEERITVLEQKMKGETLDASSHAGPLVQNVRYADFESLRNVVLNLQATVCGKETPMSHQLAENVTGIIGLKESITVGHPVLRYTWIFLFCLGVVATVFFSYATTKEYLDDPSLTKVSVINQQNYTYPPIALCNYAWFDTEKAIKLGMSTDALKYSLGYVDNAPYNIKLENDTEARKNFTDAFSRHEFNSVIDYYMAIAVDVELAPFEQEFFKSQQPTANSRAEKVFLGISTICYAFSLQPVDWRTSTLYSYSTAVIAIKYADKTAGVVPTSPYWILYLSKDKDTAYSLPVVIKSATTTLLSINAEKIVSLDKPGAPCVSGNNQKKNYSSETCMANCTNRNNKKILGCQLLSLSDDNDQQEPWDYCNFFDKREDNLSLTDAIKNNSREIGEQIAKTCFRSCPHKCEKVLYQAIVLGEEPKFTSFTDPALAANNSQMQTTAIQITRAAIQRGGFLTYEELNNYSFVQLINNFGGTLGLFVGGTLLTLAQIALFFAEYICNTKKKTTTVEVLG